MGGLNSHEDAQRHLFRRPRSRHVMPLLSIEVHAVLKLRAAATGDERLLHRTHRDDLRFLVSHFWLLSESFDSLFVLFFTFSVSGTRRAELAN